MSFPFSTSGALNFSVPLTATPVNTCAAPKEGMKSITMSFTFPNASRGGSGIAVPYVVNMSTGSPAPSLSQVSALFIDASRLNSDCLVYFPDTQYLITVPKGATRLIPVFNSKTLPQFYVAVPDMEIAHAAGLVTIIALNQFVPSFESGDVIVEAEGYGDAHRSAAIIPGPAPPMQQNFFTPNFALPLTQTTNYTIDHFNGAFDISVFLPQRVNVVGPFARTLTGGIGVTFYNVNFMMDALDISVAANTTDASTRLCQLILETDTSVLIYSRLFTIGPTRTTQIVVQREDMKFFIASDATGTFQSIQMQIKDADNNVINNLAGTIAINIHGAIIDVL